jgi:hypothetical protein
MRIVSTCGSYKCSVFFPILVSPSLIVHTHHNQLRIVRRGFVLLRPSCYIPMLQFQFSIVTLYHNCLYWSSSYLVLSWNVRLFLWIVVSRLWNILLHSSFRSTIYFNLLFMYLFIKYTCNLHDICSLALKTSPNKTIAILQLSLVDIEVR